ncbi:GntR family transcriptional regulator [Microbacterium sp. JZ31]|uniref:GntR family transcriptional regulator n=1 Tax=Microbacterium sp. JZ31 TaxID=1906274 RepID=UPI0019335482|nr:GntR family transcriptional regulator [Microbacterium sp. JZ31]
MIEALEISPQRLSDMVAERIAAAIMDGTLPAGSRVRDQDLATQLGVSRMPVREALQRLQRVGLIETAASRYTRVTTVTPGMVRSTLDFVAHYTVSLLRMALAKMSEEQRQEAALQIDEIIARMIHSNQGLTAQREVNELLVSCSENEFLANLSTDIGIAIQRNLATSDDEASSAAMLPYLTALRDAVRTGDAAEGERAIRAHCGLPD